MTKKTFLAIDRDGNAIGLIKTNNEIEAERFGLRQLPGYVGCLEAKSDGDIDAVLRKLYEKAGMDESETRRRISEHPSDLRSFDLEEIAKAEQFASTGGSTISAEEVDAYFESSILNKNRKEKSKKLSPEEEELFESFRRMGLSEPAARIAAEGRK